MTIQTLEERIANAKAKVEKKTATIEKKRALIEKKLAKAEKMAQKGDEESMYEARYARCEADDLAYDIERAEEEIAETEKTIAKYEAMLAGEIEKEATIAREIPEVMKRMQSELVELWDRWDAERREALRKEKAEIGYREFCQKHSRADYEMLTTSDEEINKANERDARELVLDLYNRVKAITGEVTDWRGIHAEVGTWGFTVLNGYVIGKEGRCRVESILAGGYNIQKLHVRVLTHAI